MKRIEMPDNLRLAVLYESCETISNRTGTCLGLTHVKIAAITYVEMINIEPFTEDEITTVHKWILITDVLKIQAIKEMSPLPFIGQQE